MPVVAAGPFSIVFAKAAELLAASPNFQELVGAESAAEALPRVFYPGCNVEQGPPAPGGVLYKWPGLTTQTRTRQLSEQGTLLLTLYGELPDPRYDDPREELLEWSNIAGLITVDMLTLARCPIPAGNDFYWGLIQVTEFETDWLAEDETNVDLCRVSTLLLTWNRS